MLEVKDRESYINLTNKGKRMKIKVREESNFHGVYKITKEHRCEDSHYGFWHKLFCNEVQRVKTTYHGSGGIDEVITYQCGYELNIYKQRLEDE